MIRVLIAASSPVIRAGLEAILGSRPDVEVIAAIDTGSVPAFIADRQPDVIVSDTPVASDAPVVLLVSDVRDPPPGEAIRGGVKSVLPRDATPDEILAAAHAAVAGLITLHPDVADILLHPANPQAPATSEPLTPREVEVLRMLAEGLPNKQVAWRLGISEHTAKFHVASILNKLGASGRAEAVAAGIRRGLIPL